MQPGGKRSGLGPEPEITVRRSPFFVASEGRDLKRPSVYGCIGLEKSSFTGAYSTTFEAYMTATWSAISTFDRWSSHQKSMWHANGCNFSYADGHAEVLKWRDPRTLAIKTINSVNTPNNLDLKKFQSIVATRL